MKSVLLQQPAATPEGFTWTVTVHVGAEERVFTFESGRGLDIEIPCDSLDFERSGVESVSVVPDERAQVILGEHPFFSQIEQPLEGQLLWGGCFVFWFFVFFAIFKP